MPLVDFPLIRDLAQGMLSDLGSTAMFIEQGAVSGRPVQCVVYRDTDPAALLQDLNSEAAKALLSPADFNAPNRRPQQFDVLDVDIEGFRRKYTILDVHPVLAGNTLPLLIATIRGN
jgi:hypothetical protein